MLFVGNYGRPYIRSTLYRDASSGWHIPLKAKHCLSSLPVSDLSLSPPFSALNATMPSAQSVLSTAASVGASASNYLIPHHIQDLLQSGVSKIIHRFSSNLTIIIEEGSGMSVNKLYDAAQTYLGSKIPSSTTRRLQVSKHEGQKELSISMARGEKVVDAFKGMKLEWKFVCKENDKDQFRSSGRYEFRWFYLSFHKKHRDEVLQFYLPHVLTQSKAIRDNSRTLKLHTVEVDQRNGWWTSVNLNHPAKFSTVAMDEEAKRDLVEDLERFVRRKEFYKRVGKAWKRGYLFYGPPGTGKSSLIAAMANFLGFDVYDLELTAVSRNSDLRRLLIATANRSILVIEDIDCSIEFHDRGGAAAAAPAAEAEEGPSHRQENKVTLSGLLNFIDGLWSSSEDERIIVFTTNHKDKLDPALLRPGRMDMHIHMSYCGFFGFKTLAKNYLEVDHHPLFEEIQQLITEVEVTPAQVAEELMQSDDPDTAFLALIEFLRKKKMEDHDVRIKVARPAIRCSRPQPPMRAAHSSLCGRRRKRHQM